MKAMEGTMQDDTREVTAREPSSAMQSSRQEDELVIRPAVDIFEDANGIVVQADMPGVSKDQLNVQADGNSVFSFGTTSMMWCLPSLMSKMNSRRNAW